MGSIIIMSKIDEKIVFKPTEFDYVNQEAEVVIVGITPGNSQIKGLRDGMTKREIKRTYAFAGNMRPNLVRMLDYVGVNRLLDIETCSSLWEEDFDKVEMTSLLKEATYVVNSKCEEVMFRHAKDIVKSEKLSRMLNDGFVKDCCKYEKARLFVACGVGVYDILMSLRENDIIKAPVIAIAHPSGANMGIISCYLGKKEPKNDSHARYLVYAEEAKKVVVELTMSSC